MNKLLTSTLLALAIGAVPVLAPSVMAQTPIKTIDAEEAKPESAEAMGWLDQLNAQIDLAQAKVSQLEAIIILETEQVPARAKQALDEAEIWLESASQSVSTEAEKQIDDLRQSVGEVKKTIEDSPVEARKKLDALVKRTDTYIQLQTEVLLETDEAKLLKKRYAELEAQAAILQAQLAARVDNSGSTALSYLDAANAWYANAKANASEQWHQLFVDMSAQIEVSKKAIQNERNKAADIITKLAKDAAEVVKGSAAEEEKSDK